MLVLSLMTSAHLLGATPAARLDIRWDTSEADAALAILEKGEAASPSDWKKLFRSKCFVRLEAREVALGKTLGTPRTVDLEAFRRHLTNPEVRSQRATFLRSLQEWKKTDLESLSRKVQRFLPTGSPQSFTLCPMIKPQDNSFVFDLGGKEPSIFLYLDPNLTQPQFEVMVAHESHHVGLGGHKRPDLLAKVETQSQQVQDACQWMGAFGEGFAMLAAAGGPDAHPHAVSKVEDRERWDRDIANFPQHFAELDAFFVSILEGRLKGDALRQQAARFYGPEQGPWYTVGYQMAVLVERHLGHARLLQCMEDPRLLPGAYEEATAKAGGTRPHWNAKLLERLAF
ncbi:DUF5700 domain-containing putative Zn-dependent protease [Corallococcus praedator]|nr:DUF5700 domain-containing putative Zn-dependent protease [Corallococcus praedator]